MIGSLVLYAALNRFAGGGMGWKSLGRQYDGILPGRAIWYAAALACLCGGALFGWTYAAWCAASFLCWRTLGWYKAIDAGTNDGTALRDFAVMSARGLLLFPLFVWRAFEVQSLWPLAALFAASFGVGAAYHIAWHFRPLMVFNLDGVARAEVLAGAWIGIVFAVLV